jgi:hypothetical protein
MPDLPETMTELKASRQDRIVPVLVGPADSFEADTNQKSCVLAVALDDSTRHF